ncbi:ComF family protein [Mangrovimonas cancribranchiae]|uniref:Phosphoribosyltransferase family protein n=1 Tax=Mangrovimonas cancribranchiae TaxID=3080055 RepID=A0AAU6NWD6_9FLAO
MFESIIRLFFPDVCLACTQMLTDNEIYICTSCRHNLPVTNQEFGKNNGTYKALYGRVKIESAISLLLFEKKGITQKLLHNLKYRGYEQVGEFLGKWLGETIKETSLKKDVDIVIPVPIHKKKLRKRKYNQVDKCSQEIACALEAEYYKDVLIKARNITSQVDKSRFKRWFSNQEVFQLKNASKIENKHILLVDDIITTGATMEACISVLHQAKNVKISIATMAIA